MMRSFMGMLILGLSISACSTSHVHSIYRGTLYFALGQSVYAMNLKDRHVRVVYYNPKIVIHSLEKLDEQRLLLGYREQMQPGAQIRDHVAVINRLTGSVSVFGRDIDRFAYLSRQRIVVFYGLSRPISASSRWGLYWTDMDTPLQSHLIDDTGTYGSIIAVSNHQVVYTVGAIGGNFRVRMYDFDTHRSSYLNLPGCDPVLWRSETSQLVCSQIGSNHYYLVRLDGSDKLPIHVGIFNGGLYMAAYIKKYDAAVMSDYGGLWFSFKHGFYGTSYLYLYDFRTRKLIHLSDDYAVNPGAAVWYPS